MRLKKIAALVMAAALAVSMFTSCGWDEEEEDGSSSSSSSSSSTSDNNSSGGGSSGGNGGSSSSSSSSSSSVSTKPTVTIIVGDPTTKTETAKKLQDDVEKEAQEFVKSEDYGKLLDELVEVVNSNKDLDDDEKQELQSKIDEFKDISKLGLENIQVDIDGLNMVLRAMLEKMEEEQSYDLTSVEKTQQTICTLIYENQKWTSDNAGVSCFIMPADEDGQARQLAVLEITITVISGQVADALLENESVSYQAGLVPITVDGIQYDVVVFAIVRQPDNQG